MEYVVIASVLLQMFAMSYQVPMGNVSQSLKSTLSDNLDKEHTSKNALQKKLVEENHQLGFLLQVYQQNEEAMQKLIEHCKSLMVRQKRPENIGALQYRRSNNFEESTTKEIKNNDTPIISIVKFGKNFRRYGSLITDMISNEMSLQIQPILDVVSSTEITKIPDFNT